MADFNAPEEGNQGALKESEAADNQLSDQERPEAASRFGWLKVLGIVVAATMISTVIAVWAVTSYLFPKELKPVTLSPREEKVLEAKIEQLGAFDETTGSGAQPPAFRGTRNKGELP